MCSYHQDCDTQKTLKLFLFVIMEALLGQVWLVFVAAKSSVT